MTVTAETMKITPDLARVWLECNVSNRTLRHPTVQRYAGAMRRGEWLLTGEAIKFTADDVLLDGQHRLAAIVLADVPVEMMVVRGVEPAAQEAMDAGKRRTASDALHLRGAPNSVQAAATVASIHKLRAMWESGQTVMWTGSDYRLTTPQIIETYAANDYEIQDAIRLGRLWRQVQQNNGMATGVAFFARALDAADAEDFFARVGDGAQLANTDPRFHLRAMFTREMASVRHAPKLMLLGSTIKAWNAWRRGEEMRLLKFAVGGATRERLSEME